MQFWQYVKLKDSSQRKRAHRPGILREIERKTGVHYNTLKRIARNPTPPMRRSTAIAVARACEGRVSVGELLEGGIEPEEEPAAVAS